MDPLAKSLTRTTALALAWCAACAGAQPPGGDDLDPAKVLGSDACKKCHAPEIAQWERTPHAMTIDTLHRKPEAKAIADRLGLRSVKRNDTCVRCHYTPKLVRGRPRIDSGVSCESCHGASQDWVELHAEYGPGVTRETEAPDARQRRRLASIAAGMNNPSNLYLIARQCLDCHTTPDEKLVDVGGHSAGSRDFELVSWSQGMVRHNFVRGNGANAPSALPRVRVMHVVGVMTDLEYSLRAVAKATTGGVFAKAAAQRAAARKQTLWALQRRLDDPLVQPALDAVATLELKLGNGDAVNAAADAIADAAYAFAERAAGERLAAIDDLLPNPTQYK
ncbi:Perchlorate reductase subunit gamma precursor [Planctomycetes bacterium MalM25]|nr:Perchlorate reductase subunit gamma precursor [Planctomycetes bacterium MalM25]